ncbi:hypothetical protein BGZ58_002957 [Dissophora ornata]|nr:hypothetical protein BGZ58_002957 [Dissophora ornata]
METKVHSNGGMGKIQQGHGEEEAELTGGSASADRGCRYTAGSPRANELSMCGKSPMEHENEQCPGEQPDPPPEFADRAALTSLEGLQYLGVMERRGYMTIELFKED